MFGVGVLVFLYVSPMKDVMWFGRKGKLSPRNIDPFEILHVIGEVVYELTLAPILPLFIQISMSLCCGNI